MGVRAHAWGFAVSTPTATKRPAHGKAVEALRAVRAERAKLETLLAAARSARRELQARREAAAADFESAKSTAGAKAAESVSAKKPIPELRREESVMRRAMLEMEACDAAMPEADAAVRRAEAAVRAIQPAETTAVLDLDAVLAKDAVASVAGAIGELAEPLARLAAVSLIRSELIGTRFDLDSQRHRPLGAAELVSRLVASIPAPLSMRLDVKAIGARAAEMASAALKDIKE